MSLIIIVKQKHVIQLSALFCTRHHMAANFPLNSFKTWAILEKFLFSLLRPEFDGVLRYTKYLKNLCIKVHNMQLGGCLYHTPICHYRSAFLPGRRLHVPVLKIHDGYRWNRLFIIHIKTVLWIQDSAVTQSQLWIQPYMTPKVKVIKLQKK
jgi:hypothetical protein